MDPKQLHGLWLRTLSEIADTYLRSPIFLTWMRSSFALALQAQSIQVNGLSRYLSELRGALGETGEAPKATPRPEPPLPPPHK